MARKIRKEETEKYFKKAECFYSEALDAFGKKRYDVSVFNASQAIILANDALCINALGKRPSKDHREAVQFHIQAIQGKKSKKEVVNEALEKRGEYGYTEKSAKKSYANKLLVKTRRFLEFVEVRI